MRTINILTINYQNLAHSNQGNYYEKSKTLHKVKVNSFNTYFWSLLNRDF